MQDHQKKRPRNGNLRKPEAQAEAGLSGIAEKFEQRGEMKHGTYCRCRYPEQ